MQLVVGGDSCEQLAPSREPLLVPMACVLWRDRRVRRRRSWPPEKELREGLEKVTPASLVGFFRDDLRDLSQPWQ